MTDPCFEARASLAEQALQQLSLGILSDAELSAWNETRHLGGEPLPEVRLAGWIEEGGGLLSKEFYVVDPTGEEFGLYRKAYFGEWEGSDQPGIVLEDHEGREIDLSLIDPALQRNV